MPSNVPTWVAAIGFLWPVVVAGLVKLLPVIGEFLRKRRAARLKEAAEAEAEATGLIEKLSADLEHERMRRREAEDREAEKDRKVEALEDRLERANERIESQDARIRALETALDVLKGHTTSGEIEPPRASTRSLPV